MAALAAIPLFWGYLLATRTLCESQRWLRWSLAYALGLLSLLVGVNIFFYILPLRPSVFLTLGLLVVASILLLGVCRRRYRACGLGTIEGPILAILSLTAFFQALFWQMQWSDEDFYVHGPFVALFLRNVFPPRNPYFEHLPWSGHYARDLSIAGLSILFGERFFAVQYFLVAANQAASVLLLHGAARLHLRSRAQALWVVLFAFAGVNFVGRRGLLETFSTSSSFASLFLFLNIYLFFTAIVRRSSRIAVLAGIALGTFALVYETTFGLLALSIALFPFSVCLLRRRWRLRYFRITAVSLVVAGLLALAQGGFITELGKRHLAPRQESATASVESRRMTHDIPIRIPKPGFTITDAFTAEEYPLWSPRLLRDSGPFVALLPFSIAIMLWLRKPWGIFISTLSLLAILVPAVVDFGLLNSESLRFLLVGGVGAAMLFGIVSGIWTQSLISRHGWPRLVAVLGSIFIAAVCFSPSVHVSISTLWAAAKYPRDHYLSSEEWGCARLLPYRHCEPIDVRAAVALRPLIRPGERVLVGLRVDNLASSMSAMAIFITFARAPVSGPGMWVMPEGKISQLVPYWDGEGFRARAFMKSGAPEILDDLGVTHVYVNPEDLPATVSDRLLSDPRFERELVLTTPDGGATREVFRVRPATLVPAPPLPKTMRLVSAIQPGVVLARDAYPIRLIFRDATRSVPATVRISYEIYLADGRLANELDEVRMGVDLHSFKHSLWIGTLWLATPFEPGAYKVRFYGWDGAARIPLLDETDRPAILTVNVS